MHTEEAPGAGVLPGVATKAQQWQRRKAECQHHQQECREAHVCHSGHCRVQERAGDARAALSRHGATEEQRAQAKKYHAGAEEPTEGMQPLRRDPKPAPPLQVQVEGEGACDQLPRQVNQEQGARQQHEGGLGAAPAAAGTEAEAGMRTGEHCQAGEVGDDPKAHAETGHAIGRWGVNHWSPGGGGDVH